ncbi:hypothetical protein Bca101_025380 [Brassica carinata]
MQVSWGCSGRGMASTDPFSLFRRQLPQEDTSTARSMVISTLCRRLEMAAAGVRNSAFYNFTLVLEISLMALEALNSPRLASPVPPLLEDSSRFHGVEHWTKGKRSKCSRSDYHHQNVTEEEYLAFCLMLLGCDGNRQLFPLPRVTVVVAEKSSLSYKCSVCDKSLSNIIEAEICILL